MSETASGGAGPSGAGWPDVVADVLGRCCFPPSGQPLTCAVSGGGDSLALMVLGVAAGCAVEAVHVDHGLRPNSAAEADVVAGAADRFGVPFESVRVVVGEGPNLEARARAARLGALPAGVATGHTLDDQAETVLVNLLRGSGLDGLAAMVPGPGHPILALRRRETRAICRALGLAWVEDPSNDDLRHLRNRVRHEILPLCAEATGRDPAPLLVRAADLAREDAALLERLAAEALPDPADAPGLGAAPPALGRRALRGWLRRQTTAGLGGAPGYPPSLAEVERVLAVARGESVATELAGGWRVRRRHRRLWVEPPARRLAGWRRTRQGPVRSPR